MDGAKNPGVSIGNRLLHVSENTRTYQDKHWKKLYEHVDNILPPTLVLTENFNTHRKLNALTTIKSLSDFMTECVEKKTQGKQLTFDSIMGGMEDYYGRDGELPPGER